MNSVLHKVAKLSLKNTFKTAKRNYGHEATKWPKPGKIEPDNNNFKTIPYEKFYGSPHYTATLSVTSKARADSCYDSGADGPTKIIIKKPPIKKAPKEQEQYSMACQVPFELSHMYQLHKTDPSINFSSESLRPTILEVIIPVQNPSEIKKNTKLPPTVMEVYPAPRNDY